MRLCRRRSLAISTFLTLLVTDRLQQAQPQSLLQLRGTVAMEMVMVCWYAEERPPETNLVNNHSG